MSLGNIRSCLGRDNELLAVEEELRNFSCAPHHQRGMSHDGRRAPPLRTNATIEGK